MMKNIKQSFNDVLKAYGIKLLTKERRNRYEAQIVEPHGMFPLATIEADDIADFIEDLTNETIDCVKWALEKQGLTVERDVIANIKTIERDLIIRYSA